LLLGDPRKYPYHTTGSILKFPGEGVFLDWNSESIGSRGVTQFGIPNVWGFSSGFPEGEDMKVSLEIADLITATCGRIRIFSGIAHYSPFVSKSGL